MVEDNSSPSARVNSIHEIFAFVSLLLIFQYLGLPMTLGFASPPAGAAEYASVLASLLQAHPDEVMRYEVVEFKPREGHHFSLEAPQDCGGGKLVHKAARELKCQFSDAGVSNIVLSVCDDSKTFCRSVPLAVHVVDRESGATIAAAAKVSENESLNHDLKAKQIPGFTLAGRNPEALIGQARAAGKPVFVMISTDWCPACNEAKEFLLASPMFRQISSDWFKIYIDGDSLAAEEWEKFVPYRYYPSFVLLNSRFQEIGRYRGSLRQRAFQAWSEDHLRRLSDPIASLRERVFARRQGKLLQIARDWFHSVKSEDKRRDEARLLRWCLNEEDAETVGKLRAGPRGVFPELEEELTRFDLSQLRMIKDQSGEDRREERLALHRKLVETTWNRDGWAAALDDFCSYDAKACASELARIDERLAFIKAKSEGLTQAEHISRLAEEYGILAEVYQLAGQAAGERRLAGQCMHEYEAMDKIRRETSSASDTEIKLSRAAYFGMVECLGSAKNSKTVNAILKPLMEAYPNEPTFILLSARLLRREKKSDQALDLVKKAETVAYGFNWFGSQILKADLLLELKKKAEAKTVIEKALEQIAPDQQAPIDSRTQRFLGRLRAMQTKIAENRL